MSVAVGIDIGAYKHAVAVSRSGEREADRRTLQISADRTGFRELARWMGTLPEAVSLVVMTDTQTETIGKQLEGLLPSDMTHDEYWGDTGGYHVFQAHDEPVGNRILELRVWPWTAAAVSIGRLLRGPRPRPQSRCGFCRR